MSLDAGEPSAHTGNARSTFWDGLHSVPALTQLRLELLDTLSCHRDLPCPSPVVGGRAIARPYGSPGGHLSASVRTP
jgi:hypothetical protein